MQEFLKKLIKEFQSYNSWQERYKKIIDYSKSIPEFSKIELTNLHEILGCENQVWFGYEKIGQKYIFKAYSEARIMRGILAIILKIINQADLQELLELNLIDIMYQLKVAPNLTQTRLKSIENINQYIKTIINLQ